MLHVLTFCADAHCGTFEVMGWNVSALRRLRSVLLRCRHYSTWAWDSDQMFSDTLVCIVQQALRIYMLGTLPLLAPPNTAQDVLALHAEALLIQ